MVHCASSSPKKNTNLTSENQVEDLYSVDLQIFFFFLNLGAKNHKNKFGVAQGGVKKWFGVGEKKEKKRNFGVEVWWSLAWAEAV